jgi:multidrug transporter EmrE-like cation transporter
LNATQLNGLMAIAMTAVAALGLAVKRVSVAAAFSNASIVVTVVLSSIFLRQPLTGARAAAVALTLLGVTLLALSAG